MHNPHKADQRSGGGGTQGSGGRAAKYGSEDTSDSDNDLASRAADAQSASSQEEEDVPDASEQEQPAAVQPVQQDDTSQRKRQGGISQQEAQQAGEVAGALNSRSIDGDDDGMLDRFGSVDMITGKPVRDLKLDPVRQLVKWRESIFGSRDSVSESLDQDDDGPST